MFLKQIQFPISQVKKIWHNHYILMFCGCIGFEIGAQCLIHHQKHVRCTCLIGQQAQFHRPFVAFELRHGPTSEQQSHVSSKSGGGWEPMQGYRQTNMGPQNHVYDSEFRILRFPQKRSCHFFQGKDDMGHFVHVTPKRIACEDIPTWPKLPPWEWPTKLSWYR